MNGDDEVDLSKAELFADSNRGVYIPQYFAQSVRRDLVTGISDEDYKVLEAGPTHESYWDAWADVLDNASLKNPKLGECYLYQGEGDLWVVPVPKETKEALGHTFVKMDKSDYEGFAGADPDSYMCCLDDKKLILILSPNGDIHTVEEDGTETVWRCVSC